MFGSAIATPSGGKPSATGGVVLQPVVNPNELSNLSSAGSASDNDPLGLSGTSGGQCASGGGGAAPQPPPTTTAAPPPPTAGQLQTPEKQHRHKSHHPTPAGSTEKKRRKRRKVEAADGTEAQGHQAKTPKGDRKISDWLKVKCNVVSGPVHTLEFSALLLWGFVVEC